MSKVVLIIGFASNTVNNEPQIHSLNRCLEWIMENFAHLIGSVFTTVIYWILSTETSKQLPARCFYFTFLLSSSFQDLTWTIWCSLIYSLGVLNWSKKLSGAKSPKNLQDYLLSCYNIHPCLPILCLLSYGELDSACMNSAPLRPDTCRLHIDGIPWNSRQKMCQRRSQLKIFTNYNTTVCR